MTDIARLATSEADFDARLAVLQEWDGTTDSETLRTVQQILADVRTRGDAAVVELTNRLDRREAASMADLEIARDRLDQALAGLPPEQRGALEHAAERLADYAGRQKMESWSYRDADGSLLGQQVTPLDRVGLYVPGGKAAYPSSVLMNAIPARVAGVGELIMVVPMPGGEVSELVLAAAATAGVDRVFAIGGAQAVAALAFGTETVPAVDKIVGPGNTWVATAKRLVYGVVGIDMIAGPSEILVVCDGRTDPDWIALDLFSQAEHDEQAQALLVSWDADFLDRVGESIDRLLPEQPRAEVIRESLANRGALIRVRDLDEAVEVANRIAPEHLELSLDDAEAVAGRIRHAGAIFLGRHTPEALGDYCAGPNHVLPTSRTARYSSPLGVYDFQKRTSLLGCSAAGAARLAPTAATLARGEGLYAHAASAEARLAESDQ
ncbi:MAG: histidinol dehydrogenase [Halofilum sp. (in: g-proteobacteria)]|nr:histidinol dehydrogenase [Halofilum sp. (in: g-proteobacteria)]